MKILLCLIMFFCSEVVVAQTSGNEINFMPITHASFVITADKISIYVDPVGDFKKYVNIIPPDIILITHDHYDHFDKKLIEMLKKQKTIVIGTKAVVDSLSFGEILHNGQSKKIGIANIEAIPSYNIAADKQQYHPKGTGNGYIVNISGKRIYISGDTEDIPEMKNLKNIDFAFICMNLPYTMNIEQAASAVLLFKPKVVYPYHYRQGNSFADVNKFKKLISSDKNIEVKILDWYK